MESHSTQDVSNIAHATTKMLTLSASSNSEPMIYKECATNATNVLIAVISVTIPISISQLCNALNLQKAEEY